jgi:guanylate kinase
MGRLFCLIGKSGSGKDTVFKRLLDDGGLFLSPVVTYTTRPRRDNEKDGVEYNFISECELTKYKNEGKIIEMRQYETVKGIWYYCTVDDGKIDLSCGNYLTIATLEAFAALKKRFGDNAVPLYITVEDGKRLSRALSRERAQHTPDYYEMCRRFLADRDDFCDARLNEAGITRKFPNDNLSRCVTEIKNYILCRV